MLSSSINIKTLEELPDEILLLICRYLSSVDVLYSFYELNYRLSKTISDYYRHVSLAQISFNQFNYVSSSILPDISTNVTSLIISNEWTGVLSKMFLNHFNETMSIIFPNLKHLKLVAFISKSLILFLDCLQNFTKLFELTIDGLFVPADENVELYNLFNRILVANNKRLNSIRFNDYSTAFSIELKDDHIVFSNIEKLHIGLKTIHDLHRLLTILPKLRCLYVEINKDSVDVDEENQYMTVPTLKIFHLQSFHHTWDLNELTCVLKRMPNIEELSLQIIGYTAIGLIDGNKIFSILPSISLKKFNYFIRLYRVPPMDDATIVSTWQQFQPNVVCIRNEEEDNLALYTLPFVFDELILRCSLATNKIFTESYTPQVRLLYLYGVSIHINETVSAIQKCHRLRRLCLQIDKNNRTESKLSEQNHPWKLLHLNTITMSESSTINIENFQKLLELSPCLYNLNIDDEFLQVLIDNESISYILKQRITHLCITIYSTKTLESIISSVSRFASVFSSLKHLYIWLEKDCQSDESLIIAALDCLSIWNCLISFATVNAIIKPEILTNGLREWVIQNSSLRHDDLFVADYFEERFRLWI